MTQDRAVPPAGTPPSGRQFPITHGDQRATVVEVGGGLRTYGVGSRALVDGYDVDEPCSGSRGLPLVPWPNRLEDGAYTFGGTAHQVPVNEPAKHNAIHGFLRRERWTCREHRPGAVTIGILLDTAPGYPFSLDVRVAYALSDAGLAVGTTVTNVGSAPCPYGSGQHPYLFAGTPVIDPCVLELDADRWLPTDDRGLPTGRRAVAGSDHDFRGGRAIGGQDIDHAFTELARDEDGLAWARLVAPDGTGVALWVDETYPFLEVYTAHTQPEPHRRRGLGMEPMTCAPNAFRSGDGLITLAPGESHTATWGIAPL